MEEKMVRDTDIVLIAQKILRKSVESVQNPSVLYSGGDFFEELTVRSGLETRFWVYMDLCYGLTT